ncbi:MAG: hypothetical protein WCP93_02900 [Candidatus Berkelbacteria bacterium]
MINIANLMSERANSILVIGEFDIEETRKSLNISLADFELVDDETIKIEQVRQLIHWIHLRPVNSDRKMLVIQNAENMTTESANALLKTLEEPPSFVLMVLTTKNEQKILGTIASRCQKIKLTEISNQITALNYLDPAQLGQMTIKERFDWTVKFAEEEPAAIRSTLIAWQIYFREKLLAGQDCLEILKEISRAKDLLETNISVKLLVENLLLKF